jgi:hypothetical protein
MESKTRKSRPEKRVLVRWNGKPIFLVHIRLHTIADTYDFRQP